MARGGGGLYRRQMRDPAAGGVDLCEAAEMCAGRCAWAPLGGRCSVMRSREAGRGVACATKRALMTAGDEEMCVLGFAGLDDDVLPSGGTRGPLMLAPDS